MRTSWQAAGSPGARDGRGGGARIHLDCGGTTTWMARAAETRFRGAGVAAATCCWSTARSRQRTARVLTPWGQPLKIEDKVFPTYPDVDALPALVGFASEAAARPITLVARGRFYEVVLAKISRSAIGVLRS